MGVMGINVLPVEFRFILIILRLYGFLLLFQILLFEDDTCSEIHTDRTENGRRRDVGGDGLRELDDHAHEQRGKDLREQEGAIKNGKVQAHAALVVIVRSAVDVRAVHRGVILYAVLAVVGVAVMIQIARVFVQRKPHGFRDVRPVAVCLFASDGWHVHLWKSRVTSKTSAAPLEP